MEDSMHWAENEGQLWQGLEQLSLSGENLGESDDGGVSNECSGDDEYLHSDGDSDTLEGVKVVNGGDEIKMGINTTEDIKDEHTHDLLDPKHSGLLPGHRKMSESDIIEMNGMLQAGIGPAHIYGHFALQYGGYDKIGFQLKDIYNQIERQRRKQSSDAMAAMEYLRRLSCDDNVMFIEHTVDEEGRLQHLFWSDGISQKRYQVFSDVVAFDATYGKNKYLLPLVVFSGVNNHNRSTIFAAAIVANEIEDTYIWLLRQFARVMNDKEPSAAITDGDVAMRNAIKIVFPNARHRLCAWHLQRNATANVKNTQFTAEFERLMLGEYDVGQFRQRTTSRCESLHAELGKYVHSRHNLTDFLHHYHRCLNHMRYKELADEFASIHGDLVNVTNFPTLEKSASRVFTKRVCTLFRTVLNKAKDIAVTGYSEILVYHMFTMTKVVGSMKEWRVSFYPSSYHFKCSCLWMESRGLPCEHIVVVLVYLNIEDIPTTLILRRWTKGALENPHSLAQNGSHNGIGHSSMPNFEGIIRDPIRASTKGRGTPSSSFKSSRVKRRTHCSYCKLSGHNRVTCPKRA
ncbi:Zinc finger, SWIM-type [Sesbania bispinosa]|nr:Zinc finger, SWIM-type [Sesbania bispinosa]